MNTQLALKSKVQPKPTRAEIIDALTQLEVQRRNDQNKADVEKRKVTDTDSRKSLEKILDTLTK